MSLKFDQFPIRPLTAARFWSWLARSAPGVALEYHRGLLILDRSPASELNEDERRTVAKIADAALKAAEDGLVHLVQRRHRRRSTSATWRSRPRRRAVDGSHRPYPIPASTICRPLPRKHGDAHQLRAPRHRPPVGIVPEPVGSRAGALGHGAAVGPTLADQRGRRPRQGGRAGHSCRSDAPRARGRRVHRRRRGRLRSGDGPDPGRAPRRRAPQPCRLRRARPGGAQAVRQSRPPIRIGSRSHSTTCPSLWSATSIGASTSTV